MTRSFHDDLYNPNLFEENHEGEYIYEVNGVGGKAASGNLVITDDPQRDFKAQLEAGGDKRRGRDHEWGHDDGGHLIGARFGGAASAENLVAQDSNFNRSAYKRAENDWAQHLEAGDKVFVCIDTSHSDRPDSYEGYAIYEHPDGTRDFNFYSFYNESSSQIEQWEEGTTVALDADSSLFDDWEVSSVSDEYGAELDDWGEDSGWSFDQGSSQDYGM